MIPLHDINPTRGRALVTYGLIAACFLVFFYELTLEATGGGEQGLDAFFLRWGAIPSRISDAIAHGQWFSQATFGAGVQPVPSLGLAAHPGAVVRAPADHRRRVAGRTQRGRGRCRDVRAMSAGL